MNFLSLLMVGLVYFAKRNIWNFLVIFVLVCITGLGLYQSALDNGVLDGAWWSSMWQNFSTEMIGAILTFALFEMLINANNRQESLIRQMGSRDNATALNAVEELRALGYLFDGTLQGKSLTKANLAGANLSKTSLARINLSAANLSDANFSKANLAGAVLTGANLLGADLADTDFDTHTILPDGTYWTTQTNLSLFTNPPKQEAESIVNDDERIILPDEIVQVEQASLISQPQVHPYRRLRAKRRLKQTKQS